MAARLVSFLVAFLVAALALTSPPALGLEPGRAPSPTVAGAVASPVPSSLPPPPDAVAPVLPGPTSSPPTTAVRSASPTPIKPAKAAAPPPEPVKLSNDPRPTFGPETFVATMSAAERYRAIVDAGGWPTVPNEATRLKPGDAGSVVAILRRRLAATGDLPEAERALPGFDESLASALRRFQARHGLEETGLVGPRTLVHLNIPAATRLKQLQASAGRLLGSKFPFGERYVAVNIPSAAVEAVERGSVARRYVAIVGKQDRASPTVETRVTSINLNPTWTVPVSLIRKDIIPHVRKDPTYLARLRIRLFDAAGNEVDPGTIDWSTERAAHYTVRQDAGQDNSLGEIRIDMPNRHSVYMHDTPSKRLFARNMRAQSSGCVRVAGVKALAAWLLEGAQGPGGPGTSWGAGEIDAAIASGRRQDAKPLKPIPVAWVYLTGYATPDGAVQFRDDVYGLDEPPTPPAPVSSAPLSSAPLPPAPPRSSAALTMEALVTSAIR